jgi:hypothetical protein
MAHDVFVSYSSKDKPIADAVVAGLENKGIRCWVAPRDITPGSSWGEAIIKAIEGSRFMVLILSGNSNRSKQVLREVERAVANDVIIIPFRIENIDPSGAMAYFLSTEHWLDALTPPIENHIAKLHTTLQHFISEESAPAIKENFSVQKTTPEVLARRWSVWTAFPVLAIAIILIVVAVYLIPGLFNYKSQLNQSDNTPQIASTSTVALISTLQPTSIPTFSLIGSWPTSREARNVFVLNGMAYIANGEDGVRILDVSDPVHPEEIGSYPLKNTQNIIVVEDIAYVIEQGRVEDNKALPDKLILLDIQSPATPHIIAEFSPEGDFIHQTLSNMAVNEKKVFLTTNNRLIVVNVSMPSQPILAGEFSFSSNITSPGIVVMDGIAYLQANQLHVIDVSNPAEPYEIGGFDSNWGSGIAVQNKIAYIASWSSGMIVLDISNPARPIKLGQFLEMVGNYELLPPGAASRQTILDVSVSGDIAYLTYIFGEDHGTWTQTLESGVIAVDISDPTEPKKIAVYSKLDEASSVSAVGDFVFLTDSSRGLLVLSKPS